MLVIGDKLTAIGLMLAGLGNTLSADENNIAAVLSQLPIEERLVVITRGLAKAAWREVDRLRKQGRIVMEIPDRSGGGEDVISQLVKETIGFELGSK